MLVTLYGKGRILYLYYSFASDISNFQKLITNCYINAALSH